MEAVGVDHGAWLRSADPSQMGLGPHDDITSGPTAEMFFPHGAGGMDPSNQVNPASYYSSPAAARAVHSYRTGKLHKK